MTELIPRFAALLTPWRLRWYPRIVALSCGASILISVLGGSGTRALIGRVGGDFPAFYGAGRVLAEGRGRELYDWKTQSSFQADLYPEARAGFLAFSYPPFVALIYWPLSRLPYNVAYLLHTALLTLALWFSVQLLRPMLPRVNRWALEGFCLAFTFMPLFRAVTGAQNTTVTLLLLAAAWRACRDKRDLLAGAVLGLMLFKPQFAIPAIFLFLLAGRFWILPAAAATGCALYALSAAVSGWAWPAWWWPKTVEFHAVDQAVNAANSVGWLGFAQAVMGAQSRPAWTLGWLLTLATGAALALIWWKRTAPLDSRVAVTSIGLVLIQPHAMYYDAGLAVLALAVIADRRGRASLAPLAVIWALSFGAVAGDWLGFNPMFFALLACGALTIQVMRARAVSQGNRSAEK